jgi:hypothetical protein
MKNEKSYAKRVFIIILLTLVFTAVEYLLLTATTVALGENAFIFILTKGLGITLIFSTHILIGWVVLFSPIGILNKDDWEQLKESKRTLKREYGGRYNKIKSIIPREIRQEDEYLNARSPKERRMIQKLLEKTMNK